MNVVQLPSRAEPDSPPTDTTPKYSPVEAALIREYQDILESGRYAKLYNASAPFPRVIAGERPNEPLPLSWLVDDFRDYCQEHGKRMPRPTPSPDYLAYRLPTVTGTMFLPKGPAYVRPKQSRHKYVNTYQEFRSEHPPLPLSPHFLLLLECMFPDPDERHTFVQYVAHTIQLPEERPSWHPMLLSATGTGKGFLFDAILTPLLSRQTRLVKKYSELTGRFANVMSGTLLIQLDDCKTSRADTQTQLKSLMSEERVLLEAKHQAAGMVSTYTRIFLASNEEVPLELDDTERRWWVPKRMEYSHGLTGDEGRKERKKNVIQPLADYLKLDGALEAIYGFFDTYPLDGFDAKSPPMTETLREQIAKSVSIEQAAAFEFLANHPTKVLKPGDLITALNSAGLNKPSNQAIGKLFASAGYRQEFLTVGGKSRWWFPVAMTKPEATAILAAQPAY
jgi:hypothetical protein